MDAGRTKKLVVIGCLCGLFSACSHPEVFSEFCSFPHARWDKKETVRFEALVCDIAARYNVTVEIRNNNSYPFSNIRLFIDCQTPSGSMRTDTLCADLADANGKWYGAGVSLYTCSFPHQLNVQYPDTGTYVYTLRQGMGADVLKGVSDIGLRISKR